MNPQSLNNAVYGSAAGAATGSMFSSLLGWAGLAYGIYSIFSSISAEKEQKKQQAKLAEEQAKQARILHDKVKADSADLYSTAVSSISQTSGAMGAIY